MNRLYWDAPKYQRLKSTEFVNDKILFTFEDGSVIGLNKNQLVPSETDEILWDQIIVEPYEISLPLITGKFLEIPWITIRLLSDPLFAAHWAGISEIQARRIGERIKALRVKRGFSSKDVAVRAGISPQSLSRIENGKHDVVFTTLQKILAAMGYSLKDLSEESILSNSLKGVIKKLETVGLSREFILNRLLPIDVQSRVEIGENSSNDSLDSILNHITQIYGWKADEILGNTPLQLNENVIWAGAKLKTSKQFNSKQTTAYAYYAHYLAILLLKATEHIRPTETLPSDPEMARKRINHLYGAITLENLTRYIWDIGIPVISLSDPGRFHGVCWKIGERKIIILKQLTQSQGRWLFDLSHELGHAVRHLYDHQSSIIEVEEISPFNNDDQEYEATDFAMNLLLNNRQEELAEKCVEVAKGKIEYLKSAVIQVSASERVPVDLLANYLAYRLEKTNSINWWGSANNLQIIDQAPGKLVNDLLLEKIELNKLNPEDKNLIIRSLQSPN